MRCLDQEETDALPAFFCSSAQQIAPDPSLQGVGGGEGEEVMDRLQKTVLRCVSSSTMPVRVARVQGRLGRFTP